MTSQVIQIVGAVAILAGFVAAQLRIIDVRSWTYLWLNAAGAAVLTVIAWHEDQWGFFVLEGVWTIVAAIGLVQKARARRPAPS